MLGIALALIAVGLMVLYFFPILGVLIGALGVIFVIGLLAARWRRGAAESGGP
jgi:hypothetical protein